MNTAHAVLTHHALHRIVTHQGKRSLLTIPMEDVATRSLSSLCSLAIEQRLTHVWIHPDTGIVPTESYFQEACEQWDLFASWFLDTDVPLEEGVVNELVSVTGFKKPRGGQVQIQVIFPAHVQWTWCHENITPAHLLQVVAYMERALQVAIGSGPTTVGMKLLQDLNASHKERLAPPTCSLDDIPFQGAACPIQWEQLDNRNIIEQGMYLHKVDKNSSYLRSCVEEYVGIGNPYHVNGDSEYKENAPALWYARIDGIQNARLPHPSWYPYDNYCHWYASPMIKCLRKMGYTVHIQEGWVFPEKYKVLASWAQTLWNARQSFRNDTDTWKNAEVREDARDGIKDIATSTVGLFASEKLRQDNAQRVKQGNTPLWKYRPDRHKQVVAGARATMMYNLVKFSESGYYPLLVWDDAIFYVTPHQDITQDIPDILKYKDSLGGYKHEYTLPIDEQVEQVLQSRTALSTKIGMLNTLADAQD